jgi:hypothetical protein
MIKGKRGNILTENLIFIILNIVFLIILVVFLVSKTGGAAVLEEKYAKQIALAIDSAKPGMTITINMEDAIERAGDEGMNIREIVTIEDNIVTVKLRERGGYSYSYFNDVLAPTSLDNDNKGYFFTIEEK